MAEPLKVGLAGLGTVGSAVIRLLNEGRDKLVARCGRPIEVVALSARARGKKRDFDVKKFRWFADPVALASDPSIDVLVEVIGGEGDPAKRAIETALAGAKPVVTANKALLARHGQKLAALAERHGVALNFEAAVAGGIPIVKTLREGLNGASFSRIYGILNGTCNYILTRMEQDRLAFDDCLREAQRLGYAEADPTFDVEGHDTAQKLAILASLAFGTRIDPDAVYVEGISSIALADLDAAAELGYRVKLLGVAVKTQSGIEQRVHPTMVPKDSAIAQVMGVTNAVTVDAEGLAPITLVGPGAGGAATASAIIADLADIARGVVTPPFGRPFGRMTAIRKAPMQHHEGGYYIRLLARDRPGTAATIARRLAQQKISLESIVQRHPPGSRGAAQPGRSGEAVPVIMITYATSEDAVHKALAAVRRDRVVSGRPQVIRIERA
ncbi:MAG TPA: homoserine dehydrogenase [Xanthobacteraceae bacterium]|nr:homoserine dehydrogenase [Xanthobacteraceae bacterium]